MATSIEVRTTGPLPELPWLQEPVLVAPTLPSTVSEEATHGAGQSPASHA
jgi:hypothetical protein